MFLMVAGSCMPALLVFGVYHLMVWFSLFGINKLPFWKRVGTAAAISHFILVIGFFAFSYIDFSLNQTTTFVGLGFDAYLFNRSEFWRMIAIFDTAPMLALLGIVGVLDRLNWNPGGMVALSICVTLVVGTVQWYLVGGVIGVVIERFWTGLKRAQDESEDWFG